MREVLQHYFPGLPEWEIAKIYRDTWCLGAGKCTIQNFITILNEMGMFIRLQKLATFHPKL
jgi:hypothetical protein